MHAVISLLLHSRKFWWYFLLTSSLLLDDVIMTSYCCQRYAECLVTTLFQQDSAPAHCAAHVQQLNCCVEETPNFLASKLWPLNNPDFNPVDYEIWAVMQHRVYQRQIHSVDELRWPLIVWTVWCGLQLLTMLLTSGEEDLERVSVLKEELQINLWTECWFCPYLLQSMRLVWLLHLQLQNHASNVGQYILVHFTR